MTATATATKPKRYITSRDLPFRKDENGKPLCRWCQKPVAPPRRSWCSDECVKEFLVRNNTASLRAATFKRDRGVCAACGADTEKIRRVFDHAKSSYSFLIRGRLEIKTWRDWPAVVIWTVFTKIGFNRESSNSIWEADHIKEVVNGGDSSPENIQTLCIPCHKAKTKGMHAERAKATRDLKRNLLKVENHANQ